MPKCQWTYRLAPPAPPGHNRRVNPRQAHRAGSPFLLTIAGAIVAAALVGGAPLAAQMPDADATNIADTADTAVEIAPGIYRLSGIDEDLPQDELQPLRRMLRRAEVVGLGEAIHTTRGFSRAKFRLFKYLVERAGFRVFGFESPWIDAERVALYVETCEGSAEDAIEGLFGVWQNESVLELVQWMCDHNRVHPDDPVAFYGFDHQQAWHDAPALKGLLVSFGIPAKSSRVVNLDQCEGATSLSAWLYYNNREAPVPEKHTRCMNALSRNWRFLTRRAPRLVRTGEISAVDVAWAKIHLVGLRAFQEQMFYEDSDRPRAFEARDAGMAYIAQEIRALRFPRAKTALWAHNAHLAAGGKYLPETLDMGYFLHEDLGSRYEAIGLVALESEIDWPGVGCGPAKVALNGSLEDFLSGFNEPYLLVDLDFRGAVEPPLDSAAPWEVDGRRLVPREEFRALLYLERAEKMIPVHWRPCA